MRISINPHQALEIQTFEEFRTVSMAVEQYNGEGHPLTQHLRNVVREHFDYRTGAFIPEVIQNTDEVHYASVAFSALEKLAVSDDVSVAPAAAYILDKAEVVVGPIEPTEITDPVPAFRDPPVRT